MKSATARHLLVDSEELCLQLKRKELQVVKNLKI